MIPKIIHYCWFGRNEKNKLVKKCMKSWKKLEKAGYEIKEWNEDNCDMNENEFVKYCYENKKWGFLGDYFRYKIIYENGGIYLDTDVLVYKTFDDLLDCDYFGGFIYDCALGTAVFGGVKGNSVCKDLKNFWNETKEVPVSNGVVTEYFYENVKNFLLNGNRQTIVNEFNERIEIYPKEELESGKFIGKSHTLHFSDCCWGNIKKRMSATVKFAAAKLPVNFMAKRKIKKAEKYLKANGKYQEWYFSTVNGKKEL